MTPFCHRMAPFCRTLAPIYRTLAPICRPLAPFCDSVAPFCHTLAPIYRPVAPFYRTLAPFCRPVAPFYDSVAPFIGPQVTMEMPRLPMDRPRGEGNTGPVTQTFISPSAFPKATYNNFSQPTPKPCLFTNFVTLDERKCRCISLRVIRKLPARSRVGTAYQTGRHLGGADHSEREWHDRLVFWASGWSQRCF